MFLWYKKQRRRKKKTLRDKTSKKTHENFRRKNSCYFKFFIIVVILLRSEPLPGQVSQHLRCSMEKGVLRDFTKFTKKHLRQSLFFEKVAG